MPDKEHSAYQSATSFGAGTENAIEPLAQQEAWNSQTQPRANKGDSTAPSLAEGQGGSNPTAGVQTEGERQNLGNPTVRSQTFSGKEIGRLGYLETSAPGPHGQVAAESGSLAVSKAEPLPAAMAGSPTDPDVQRAGAGRRVPSVVDDAQVLADLADGFER